MKAKFWGTRGSISTPEINKLKVGGNTSCIEVTMDDKRLILDAGTGIRALGKTVAKEIVAGKPRNIYILLSHTHWDHIQGFPFFAPVFLSDTHIHIFGPAKANRKLENLLSGQMEYDYWPVKFNHLAAKFYFHELTEGAHTIMDGVQITARRHIHPGVAFGYRIEYQGHALAYLTDTEHFQNTLDKRVIELSEGADLLVHDAQYTEDEIAVRYGWGHSTWQQAVNVAIESKSKSLALFHQDPERVDDAAFEIEKQARAVFPAARMAVEGVEIEF